jgi:hypothetical protein
MDYLQISHVTSGRTHSSKWTKWFMNKEKIEKKERQNDGDERTDG